MDKITTIGVYQGEDYRWYYCAWSGTAYDHNDLIPDAESETEAVEWVRRQWPNATVRLAS